MTLSKAQTAHRAAQIAPPTYRISDKHLDAVVAALPALIAGAPPAWHRTHRKWVAQEIAALRPADAVQALAAAHIVVARHRAASLTSEALRETGSLAFAGSLNRTLAALARAGVRLEQMLRLLRRRAASERDGLTGEGRTGEGRADHVQIVDVQTGDVPDGDVPGDHVPAGDGLAREGLDLPGPDAILSINPLQLSAIGPEPAAPATGRRPGGPDGGAAGFGTRAPPLFFSAGASVASRARTLVRSSRPKRASRARSTTAAAPATGGGA